MLEECSKSALFLQFVFFVLLLTNEEILERGDIFVVDNCSIHYKGDNLGIQELLFWYHGILMITLPPYHPDYNQADFVFLELLARINSERMRYKTSIWRIFYVILWK